MDSLAVNDGISCAPKTAFILRSLQVECLANQQALHPGDEAKDMWEIFIKGLAAFVRRTQTRDAKYKRDRYTLSQDIVEKTRIMLNTRDADSLPSEIYRLMSWIAMDANFIQEAIRWTEYWLKFLNANEASTTALSVLCKVRLATIEVKALRVVLQDNVPVASDTLLSLENKVGCAIEGLQNVARGKKQELQLLLQEVGQLRRSGLGILAPVMDEGCNHSDSCAGSVVKRHIPSETRRRLRSISDKIIKGVIHFCRKYVSMGIAEEDYSMLQSILTPAMDTALSACWRGFDVEFSESWANAEALIAECWVAANALERDGATDVDTTFYEKVSNAYWQIFLLYRKTPESISKAVRALQKSTAVMDGRPGAELTRASVSLKYEILGAIFVSGGNQHKGAESFHSAIRTATASGLLNVLGERATNGETLANIINDKDKETASIGRALSGLVRMANGKQDNETAKLLRLNGDGLSVAARGILLEWCFALALDMTDNDGSAAREIGERLLELYDVDEMPVRRARIIGRLLGLAIDQPGTLNGEEVQGLGIEILDWAASPTVGLGADKSLIAVKDDMMANIFVGLAVCKWQERTTNPDLVWKALRSWTVLLDHNTDWDSLSRIMDDPHSVIKRLGMLVEFFGMKGESALSLASLELLLRFRNVERPANYDGKFLPSSNSTYVHTLRSLFS
jgi:separase